MEIDEHGRPHPPATADEVTTLRGFLDHHRATLTWKTRGVDAEGLRATVGASTMTLGGMLKHLAYVEDFWFSFVLRANEWSEPWASTDWSADADWDWHSAADDEPDELRALWSAAVAHSEAMLDEAVAGGGLEQLAERGDEAGRPSLRWILVHMIEEYARHNGHADLLREAWDGDAIGE